MLGNRLRKNLKHLSKWAKREAIECFRVYDADIPEVPLVVDKYLDHAHVALWVGNVARVRCLFGLARRRLVPGLSFGRL